MNLVIVETPAQAKRVADALGEGWQVEPCYGAVRDLPADALGVDVRHDFQPTYTLLPRKGNLVRRLMRAISKTDAVYIATSPDRVGEAMGWHLLALSPALENKPIYRSLLHALTPDAIRAAFDSPRVIDMNWVEAEETRRIVDRLIGYLVSPLASKALNLEASFTRAEVDCLRLLVEREREITAFKPTTTWMLIARLSAEESEVRGTAVQRARRTTDIQHTAAGGQTRCAAGERLLLGGQSCCPYRRAPGTSSLYQPNPARGCGAATAICSQKGAVCSANAL